MQLLETAGGLLLFAFAAIVPGYFLCLAFFPSKKELDLIERLALSIFFSVAFVAIAVLLENQFMGVQVNFISVAATMLVLIAAGLAVFLARTGKINAPAQFYRAFPKIGESDAADLVPRILR